MHNIQPGILAEVPQLARYMFFSLTPGANPRESLYTLSNSVNGESAVAGFGLPLIKALEKNIPGLRSFPTHTGPGFSVPSTPAALWVWLRGDDRGDLLHQSRHIEQILAETFNLDKVIDAFQYRDSRDLTGYEDGTENPEDEDAVEAAIVQNHGVGMAGSSFVTVQQWVHDLDCFQAMPQEQQDNTIGRRISDNEEIEEAPESAHVKRTAQEDFDPEAFVVRRSMPWADSNQAGLVFVAFGRSFDAFEALLKRMVGDEDGIVDALFSFTHPINGSYFWCPPLKEGKLDLSAIGL
ncbi:MAG: Dyp-type peroxidase [Candidatus Thiodiazotropha sp.]|jgi:putative iron-dependent peroxidase